MKRGEPNKCRTCGDPIDAGVRCAYCAVAVGNLHTTGGDEKTQHEKAERAKRIADLAARAAARLPLFMGPPSCPKCGGPMQGGAPHGPWPVQWECPRCRHILVPSTTNAERGAA